jgi:hypothetical protein
MLEATRDIPSEDVRRERTRVAADHPLAKRYPDAFVESRSGPPSKADVRYSPNCRTHVREGRSERASTRRRMPLHEELAVRAAVVARIERDRDRGYGVHDHGPSAEDLFWADTQHLLEDPARREQRLREEREDREAQETADRIAELSPIVQKLREIDEAWGPNPPWQH